MGLFGRSPAKQRMTGYEDAPTTGERIASTARGMFGKADRFAGRFADEMLAPTSGVGKLGQALRYSFDEDYRDSMLEQQEAEASHAYRLAQLSKLDQPTYQNVSGVGLVRINPDGTTETAVEAQDDPATAPAGVREWEYMQSLPPEQREQFQRFRQPVPYGFTPQGIQAQAQVAAATAAAREPYQSSGGGRGAGGVSPALAAKYRAEAAAAIQKGADPAAVNARLAQILGGQ